MSAPTTDILLNQVTPAAPSDDQNVTFVSDGATPLQSITAYPKRMVGDSGSGGKAGTVPPPAAGDAAAGKFLKADGTWTTVSGSAGNTILNGSGAPSSSLGTDGDFYLDTTNQVLYGPKTSGAWGSGLLLVDRVTRPVSAVIGKPAAAQRVMIYTAETVQIYAANLAGSVASCATNPTSTATYTLYKNSTISVGSVTVSTSGAFTFATTGGTSFTLNVGDRLEMVAPGTQDATLSDVAITLIGTKGTLSTTGFSPTIFSLKGAYNGSTTYSILDVVTYTGSSYACILASTGNLPTNTTYWQLIAQGGTNGINGQIQIVDFQNETAVYCVDSGSANVVVVTPSTAATSYVAGLRLMVKMAAANTAASTINVSGLGTKAITKSGTTALTGAEWAANQIVPLVYDGTQFQIVGGGGNSGSSGLVLLASQTVSNVSSIDIVSRNAPLSGAVFQSDYDEYEIHFLRMVRASSSKPYLRFSTNGGSTWDSSAIYQWTETQAYVSGGGPVNSGGDTGFIIWDDTTDTEPANSCSYAKFTLFDPLGAFWKVWQGQATDTLSRISNNMDQRVIGGVYKNTAAVNAFRVIMSTGNVSGTVRVYGVSR